MTIMMADEEKVNLPPVFTLQTWANFVGAGVLLVISYFLISGTYIKQQPWMNTATLPFNQKTIAVVEAGLGQRWVLAPIDCVGTDRHLLAGCENQAIELPILP